MRREKLKIYAVVISAIVLAMAIQQVELAIWRAEYPNETLLTPEASLHNLRVALVFNLFPTACGIGWIFLWFLLEDVK